MTPRVLILTAGFGDGHNAAARNLEAALRQGGSGSSGGGGRPEVVVRDLFAESAPTLNRLARFAYRMTITFAPRLWQALYEWAATEGFARLSAVTLAPVRRHLHRVLSDWRPDAVVSTYPAYPPLIAAWRTGRAPRGAAKPDGGVPLSAVVVTDAITIHPVWILERADRYYVADETTAGVLEDRFGIDATSVVATGFPVSPAMPDRLAARAAAGPRPEAPLRVLFFPTRSRRDVTRQLAALREAFGGRLALSVLLGRHARRLGPAVAEAAARWPREHRPEIHEWVDEAWALMTEHDLVIAKAGGATVHEAIAARCPIAIDKIVPGQEEGNARLVETLPCGWVADTNERFERLARHLARPGIDAELARFRGVLEQLDAASAASSMARDLLGGCRRIMACRAEPVEDVG